MSNQSQFGVREQKSLGHGEQGAQLVEFAVALPLLVLFVVGIFDFSGAYTLKQRLTNIARDSARVAARDAANDLQGPSGPTGLPGSVVDAFQTVDKYLLGSNLSDCGVRFAGPATNLTWLFTSPSGGGCVSPGLTIIVNRGYTFPLVGATPPTVACQSQPLGGQTAVIGTCVSVQYAYAWKFGRAASVLGANTILPPQISAVAVAVNEN
jgi:TadE-like protein